MASMGENILPEGSSVTKPPGFNGEHYAFWKMKMKVFIKAMGYDLWNVIEEGDYVPMKAENDLFVRKFPSEYTAEDKEKLNMNNKAILMLQSALSQKEYFRISNLETAKEMWEALEIAHEGTAGVKQSRVNTLTTEYELFRMNKGETIREMEIRFTHIINHLSALGKKYSQEDQIRKILSVLIDDWQAKVTAIEESKEESIRSVAALFGSLAEHEGKLKHRRELTEKKKKSLALASKEEVEEDDEMDDEEMSLIVRRFKKFYKRNAGRRF